MSERVAGATGTIHDQGYQRYQGERLPQSRRFLVIARNVMAVAWKSRWGVKLPVLGAGLTLVVAAGIMIAFGQIETRLGGRGPKILSADAVLFYANQVFALWGVILAATVASPAVADDLKSGAFQFYFSRPLRPDDYVLGKLVGLLGMVGLSTFIGPLLLSIVRVCMVEDFAGALRLLPLVPKAMLLGVVSTTALVLPAVGLGALLGKRAPAIAACLVFFLVVSMIAHGIAEGLELPLVRLLAIDADVSAIASALFGIPSESNMPEAWQAALALIAFSVAGYLALRRRIRSSASAGLGGV